MEAPGVSKRGWCVALLAHCAALGKSASAPLLCFMLALVVLAAPVQLARAEPVDFELPQLNGEPFRLSSLRGSWVVVNFWATWCPSCVEEMGELERFHRSAPDRVVVGVNFEELPPAEVSAFVKRLGISFPVVQAGEYPLMPFEPLKGLPTTAIVSPTGEMVAHHTGPVTAAALNDFIARELGAQAEAPARGGVQAPMDAGKQTQTGSNARQEVRKSRQQ